MSKDWVNDLRRKMENHTEDVPEGLWEDIRSELFENERPNIVAVPSDVKGQVKTNSKLNFKTIGYKMVSVAAVIAFIFFGINHYVQISQKHKTGEKNILSKNSKTEIISPLDSDYEIAHDGNSFNNDIGFKNNIADRIFDDKKEGNIASESLKKFFNETVISVFNSDQPQSTSESNQQNQIYSEEITKVSEDDSADNKELIANNELEKKLDLPKIKKDKSWMIGVVTGNASSTSAGEFPGYATFNGSNMSISDVFHSSGTELNPLTQVLLANQNQDVEAKIKHKMPITFGASIYYNIGKRWGIGTGVTYTKLSSDLHSGSDSNYIQSNQTISYVGIPVQVNYNVIKKPKFTGYLAAGALIEKSVSGTLKTKYVVENTLKNETEEKLGVKPTQFSVNAAAGVQVNITNNIGIYAEPGLGYHFKDNSSLQTIYKEKPLNFNLKFGLRLSLD